MLVCCSPELRGWGGGGGKEMGMLTVRHNRLVTKMAPVEAHCLCPKWHPIIHIVQYF